MASQQPVAPTRARSHASVEAGADKSEGELVNELLTSAVVVAQNLETAAHDAEVAAATTAAATAAANPQRLPVAMPVRRNSATAAHPPGTPAATVTSTTSSGDASASAAPSAPATVLATVALPVAQPVGRATAGASSPAGATASPHAAGRAPAVSTSDAGQVRRVPKWVVPWQPDSYSPVCTICRVTQFGVFTRQHHCRLCGALVCGACSTYRVVLPLATGSATGEQRACRACRMALSEFVKKLNARLTADQQTAANAMAQNATASGGVTPAIPLTPTPTTAAATAAPGTAAGDGKAAAVTAAAGSALITRIPPTPHPNGDTNTWESPPPPLPPKPKRKPPLPPSASPTNAQANAAAAAPASPPPAGAGSLPSSPAPSIGHLPPATPGTPASQASTLPRTLPHGVLDSPAPVGQPLDATLSPAPALAPAAAPMLSVQDVPLSAAERTSISVMARSGSNASIGTTTPGTLSAASTPMHASASGSGSVSGFASGSIVSLHPAALMFQGHGSFSGVGSSATSSAASSAAGSGVVSHSSSVASAVSSSGSSNGSHSGVNSAVSTPKPQPAQSQSQSQSPPHPHAQPQPQPPLHKAASLATSTVSPVTGFVVSSIPSPSLSALVQGVAAQVMSAAPAPGAPVTASLQPNHVMVWLRTIELAPQYDGARALLRYWLWRGYPCPSACRPLLWLTLTDALTLKRRAAHAAAVAAGQPAPPPGSPAPSAWSAPGPGSGSGSTTGSAGAAGATNGLAVASGTTSAHAHDGLNAGCETYAQLCRRPPSVESIWRDVPRSAPNETFLKYFGRPAEVSREKFDAYLAERPRQRALYRILTAYSNFAHRKVDYCQGMNYIASLLLLVLGDEENAFWAFVSVLSSARHGLSDLFLSHRPYLKQVVNAFDAELKARQPLLHAHMSSANVISDAYAVEFFSTAFVYSCNFKATVRIWDVFLTDGFDVLSTVAHGVMECVAPTLMAKTEDPDLALQLLRKCIPQLTSRMIFSRVIEQAKL